jgi:uncharacterized protein (UPF0335 family)
MQKQAQAQQQAEQQQMQLAMENQAIVTKSVDAKAESDHALAAERLAKIQLDAAVNVERINRAEEEKTAGALNLIKAAKELKGMDIDHFLKQVQAVMLLVEPPKAEKAAETPKQAS